MISTLLQQYGNHMVLVDCTDGVETEVKAFLQPAQTKSWQNTSAEASPLGMVSQGQYVYIGPASVAISEDTILLWEHRAFSFRRAEPFFYHGICVYMWGLCVEKGVDDSWGR